MPIVFTTEHIPMYWLRDYNASKLRNDVVAGLIVLVLAIPQSVAYAHLAGLPPVCGLHGCILPPILYALTGTSMELSVGPVAILSILVGNAIREAKIESTASDPSAPLRYATTIGFYSGLFGLIITALGFGRLSSFINKTVISGFTAGAALTIMASQLATAFNVSPASGATTVLTYLTTLGEALKTQTPSWITILGSILSTLFLLGIRWQKRIDIPAWFPSHLCLVSIAMATTYGFDLQGPTYQVMILGDMPSGMPQAELPEFGQIGTVWSSALLVTVVGFMEAYSAGVRIALRRGYTLQPNRELGGISFMNFIVPSKTPQIRFQKNDTCAITSMSHTTAPHILTPL